ncbi:helix-turn-helix domain-containing protein [Marinobacterium litorale]|uniref:helix-turn-helix domain-containing protein n=1 Tax=Marinobacterium litorale TaxID=404770 RepID=UPI0006883EAA|nr:helix-turn-helix transcriptional regulator [Marinobacterium litorale]
MSNKRTDIGERITRIRGDKSQIAFANELGVHKNTLGNYERGRNTPDADFLAKLAGIGVNTHWVITGEGPLYLEETGAGDDAADSTSPSTTVRKPAPIDSELFKEVIQLLRDKDSWTHKIKLDLLIDDVIRMYNDAVRSSNKQRQQLEMRLYLNSRHELYLELQIQHYEDVKQRAPNDTELQRAQDELAQILKTELLEVKEQSAVFRAMLEKIPE